MPRAAIFVKKNEWKIERRCSIEQIRWFGPTLLRTRTFWFINKNNKDAVRFARFCLFKCNFRPLLFLPFSEPYLTFLNPLFLFTPCVLNSPHHDQICQNISQNSTVFSTTPTQKSQNYKDTTNSHQFLHFEHKISRIFKSKSILFIDIEDTHLFIL